MNMKNLGAPRMTASKHQASNDPVAQARVTLADAETILQMAGLLLPAGHPQKAQILKVAAHVANLQSSLT